MKTLKINRLSKGVVKISEGRERITNWNHKVGSTESSMFGEKKRRGWQLTCCKYGLVWWCCHWCCHWCQHCSVCCRLYMYSWDVLSTWSYLIWLYMSCVDEFPSSFEKNNKEEKLGWWMCSDCASVCAPHFSCVDPMPIWFWRFSNGNLMVIYLEFQLLMRSYVKVVSIGRVDLLWTGRNVSDLQSFIGLF